MVIGGSLSGLAAAYALTRVGHRVLVLEMRHDFLDVSTAQLFPVWINKLGFRKVEEVGAECPRTFQRCSTIGA